MDCSMPGFSFHHHLPELAQTYVHRVSEAIQPSHPLSSPSPPAFNLSKNQGLFQWLSSSHQLVKVLKFQLQHQSFQWIFRTNSLWVELVGSPCSPRDSQESSPTPQFKNINSLVLSFLYSPILTSIHAAAAAKSHQSCPTLNDPRDGSPPGSCPWDSPGKNTGVGCHFRLQHDYWKNHSFDKMDLCQQSNDSAF